MVKLTSKPFAILANFQFSQIKDIFNTDKSFVFQQFSACAVLIFSDNTIESLFFFHCASAKHGHEENSCEKKTKDIFFGNQKKFLTYCLALWAEGVKEGAEMLETSDALKASTWVFKK